MIGIVLWLWQTTNLEVDIFGIINFSNGVAKVILPFYASVEACLIYFTFFV